MITDAKKNVYSKGIYYTGNAVVDGKKAHFFYEEKANNNITIRGKLSDAECLGLKREIISKLSTTAK